MGWDENGRSYEETPPRDETPAQRTQRLQKIRQDERHYKEYKRELALTRQSSHLRSCERLPPHCKNGEYSEASEKVPVCLLCLLECRNHQVLARHIRKQHKMQCTLCPEETRTTYPDLEHLHGHFMTHSLAERAVLESQSFPCGLNGCPKVFFSKYLLDRHRKYSRGLGSCRKKFRCTLRDPANNKPCIRKYATEASLTQHIFRKHGRPPGKQPKHICMFLSCGKRYMYRSGLEKHLMKNHCQCHACGDWLSNAECLPQHRIDRNHIRCTCDAWVDTPAKRVQHIAMHAGLQ